MKIIKDIKLITLEEMRVVSFHGFGKEPEGIAWQHLRDWLTGNGYEKMVADQRFFGFNNPNPAPGSDNYGYEQWITLPVDYDPQEGETIKVISGGLYAVGGFRDSTPESFGEAWQALADWRMDSDFLYDESRPWLEELLSRDSVLSDTGMMDFDCLMPVMKIKA